MFKIPFIFDVLIFRLKSSLLIMSLPEINEDKTDQRTKPMVTDEEIDDLNLEEEDDGEEDADQEMNCEDETVELETNTDDGLEKPKKKCVPGILYLGHIPPRMRPKHVRNMLSVYGEIGRIFLQPEGWTDDYCTFNLIPCQN